MRTILAVMLFAASAEAAPLAIPEIPTTAPPIDLATVPKTCVSIARESNARRIQVALAARISLAGCIANERMGEQKDLIDAQDSIALLEESVTASFSLLDSVIASPDPKLQIEAQHAKGLLFQALTTRMLATVPRLPASPNDDAMTLHDQRVAVLATWLQPWRDKAHDAFAAAVEIGRADQNGIARDPAASAALEDSKRQLAREPMVAPNS